MAYLDRDLVGRKNESDQKLFVDLDNFYLEDGFFKKIFDPKRFDLYNGLSR